MKDLLVHGSGRNKRKGDRFLAALFLSLAAGWTTGSLFAENGAAVISMSPSGQSRLHWAKPDAGDAGLIQEESTSDDLVFMEEEGTVPLSEASSPIKPVNLLRDDRTDNKVSPAPVTVAMTQASEEFGKVDSPAAPESTVPPLENAKSEPRKNDVYMNECPDPHKLSSIKEISYKVTIPPGEKPQSCPLPDEVYVRKLPTPTVFTWKASALCHKPLYFQDVQLERYGHTLCPILQPALSGARFWLTIPVLPYFMGVNPPNECVYDLGYYRPGSCAPNMIQPLPISARGGLIQAGTVVGAAALIP